MSTTFLQKVEADAIKIEADIKDAITNLQPLAIKALGYTTKLDSFLRSNTAIIGATLIPDGEADRDLLIVIVDEAIVDLKAVQSKANYTGILLTLATGIEQIWHGKKLTWSQYLIAVEQQFAKAFGVTS